ncbi:MAG: hypothetical protein LBV67_12590 [Streptococcaceae bacterium]|jgi:hypothetical protein|nr:hypothetical protein [Streptococcaceae bacterium]
MKKTTLFCMATLGLAVFGFSSSTSSAKEITPTEGFVKVDELGNITDSYLPDSNGKEARGVWYIEDGQWTYYWNDEIFGSNRTGNSNLLQRKYRHGSKVKAGSGYTFNNQNANVWSYASRKAAKSLSWSYHYSPYSGY